MTLETNTQDWQQAFIATNILAIGYNAWVGYLGGSLTTLNDICDSDLFLHTSKLMLDKQHTLFVCTTCASVWQNGKRVGISEGEQLLQRLQELSQGWELRGKFSIQAVECMSACNRSCFSWQADAAKNQAFVSVGGFHGVGDRGLT